MDGLAEVPGATVTAVAEFTPTAGRPDVPPPATPPIPRGLTPPQAYRWYLSLLEAERAGKADPTTPAAAPTAGAPVGRI
jgi:hypothetical protein